MKIEVGTKVFLKPSGLIAHTHKKVVEGLITKIGRKYFYVVDEKFEIETLKNINADRHSAWVLYFSEQEISDEVEKDDLLRKFRRLFSFPIMGSDLSLEQLRQMASIANLE